jgi:hypothetical protein
VLTLIIQIKKKKKDKTMISQKDHMKVEKGNKNKLKTTGSNPLKEFQISSPHNTKVVLYF